MKYKAKSLKYNAESTDCTVCGVRKFAFSVGKTMYKTYLIHYKTLYVTQYL